jgi:hypothetical protein
LAAFTLQGRVKIVAKITNCTLLVCLLFITDTFLAVWRTAWYAGAVYKSVAKIALSAFNDGIRRVNLRNRAF